MNEPANVWITHTPFVWLPMVMVMMAMVGHIVVLRRLRSESGGPTDGRPAAAPSQSWRGAYGRPTITVWSLEEPVHLYR